MNQPLAEDVIQLQDFHEVAPRTHTLRTSLLQEEPVPTPPTIAEEAGFAKKRFQNTEVNPPVSIEDQYHTWVVIFL